ncbi:MAG: hypothetical protein PVF73_07685 [Bacteroidales bacterium]|jgi:hypothetical protein
MKRKIGFKNDQEGMAKRYISERENWEVHLSNTKRFITDCLEEHRVKNVSIMGSGWLLDVPVSYLSDNPDKVVFYDIRHPGQIIHRYGEQSNFHFVEIDLTGGVIDYLLRLKTITGEDIIRLNESLSRSGFFLPYKTDYLVSVNLLNQLDILVADYLEKTNKITKKKMITTIRSIIQENHLRLLKTLPSCMVTDYEKVSLNENGVPVKCKSLIYCNIPHDKVVKEWEWDFDMNKNYDPGYNTRMRVMAVKI